MRRPVPYDIQLPQDYSCFVNGSLSEIPQQSGKGKISQPSAQLMGSAWRHSEEKFDFDQANHVGNHPSLVATATVVNRQAMACSPGGRLEPRRFDDLDRIAEMTKRAKRERPDRFGAKPIGCLERRQRAQQAGLLARSMRER
jgi:hypothetical protein